MVHAKITDQASIPSQSNFDFIRAAAAAAPLRPFSIAILKTGTPGLLVLMMIGRSAHKGSKKPLSCHYKKKSDVARPTPSITPHTVLHFVPSSPGRCR